MLESYTIGGFRSANESVHVELKSTNYKILIKSNVSSLGILKGACFVGADGAGKSTMVAPLQLLLDLLFSDNEIDLRNYFCLTNVSEKRIKISYDFCIRRQHIHYDIDVEYGKPLLIVEKLYVNKELVIDRMGSNGRYTNGDNPVHAKDIEANRIFLRDLYESNFLNGSKVLFDFMMYLKNSVYMNPLEGKITTYAESLTRNSLQSLEEQIEGINQVFNDFKLNMQLILKNDSEKVSIRVKRDEGLPLPIAMESNAVKMLVRYLPAYLHVMKNGGMLIIDDFGVLHPSLEADLIRYFEEHTEFGQLLITTNNTNLLAANVLRADQLYNVIRAESTINLVRFSSKQPRELQNMEKMYYNGAFGDIR